MAGLKSNSVSPDIINKSLSDFTVQENKLSSEGLW